MDEIAAGGGRSSAEQTQSGHRSASCISSAVPAGGRAELSSSPSSVHVVGGCRPLRAYCEVAAHIAAGKLLAATPTAFHPWPLWVPSLAFRLLWRSTWSEAAYCFGYGVKCTRIWRRVSWATQRVGGCRSVRVYDEMRAQLDGRVWDEMPTDAEVVCAVTILNFWLEDNAPVIGSEMGVWFGRGK
jgi:hypothetical protein